MYCRAVLPSAGLGNKLFPWARCRVFSLHHGLEIVPPNWTQLKLGPFLRGDRDKRMYNNLFRRSPPGYVRDARQLLLRFVCPRALPEPEDLRALPADRDARVAVLFSGERDHFRSLSGWHVTLLKELRVMTREHWVRRAEAAGWAPIGIHVRRGDFVEATTEADFILRGGLRTPMAWFITSLRLIRQICGYPVPAFVVSDATESALNDLLAEGAVQRVDTGSAIGDLLVLSKARLLIASGGSSFSAWATFLGQMPTVAYPGQSLAWFKIASTRGQYIGELRHDTAPPCLLLEQVHSLRPALGRI